jgi:SnoaL-like domain
MPTSPSTPTSTAVPNSTAIPMITSTPAGTMATPTSTATPSGLATPTLTERLRTAMLAGDERALAALLHPHARWPGTGTGAAHEGRAAVLRHYGELRARTRRIAVVETFTYPDAVVLGLELTPDGSGGGGPELVYRVFTHTEGLVTAVGDHSDRTLALDAALDPPARTPHRDATPETAAGTTAETSTGTTAEGGEPACLLHRLCPECDAVLDTPPPAACWRCGAQLAPSPNA